MKNPFVKNNEEAKEKITLQAANDPVVDRAFDRYWELKNAKAKIGKEMKELQAKLVEIATERKAWAGNTAAFGINKLRRVTGLKLVKPKQLDVEKLAEEYPQVYTKINDAVVLDLLQNSEEGKVLSDGFGFEIELTERFAIEKS